MLIASLTNKMDELLKEFFIRQKTIENPDEPPAETPTSAPDTSP